MLWKMHKDMIQEVIMRKNDLMKFLNGYTFKHNHRKYIAIVYSRNILPVLEEFKEYIVNNESMLIISKKWLEYAVNNCSMPITIKG